MEFKVAFENYESTHAGKTQEKLSDRVVEKIKKLNNLDMELYQFAVNLLKKRFAQLKELDRSYEEHISKLEMEEKETFSWGDIEKEDYEDYEANVTKDV